MIRPSVNTAIPHVAPPDGRAGAVDLAEDVSLSAADLPDVQGRSDARRLAIDRVGVRGIRHPITLAAADGSLVRTVAEVGMFVALPGDRRGTHMSRFMEVLAAHCTADAPVDAAALCRDLCARLSADRAEVDLSFPYFIPRPAPVTGLVGLMEYAVRIHVTAGATEDLVLGVSAPATSLCPCSKEISAYGAHNQRCVIAADVRMQSPISIEEMVIHLEAAASCAVFPVLKRPDEKFVTEEAFRNPKFVEDIVRDLAVRLGDDPRIRWFTARSENFESIHGHNAYAELTKTLRTPPCP